MAPVVSCCPPPPPPPPPQLPLHTPPSAPPPAPAGCGPAPVGGEAEHLQGYACLGTFDTPMSQDARDCRQSKAEPVRTVPALAETVTVFIAKPAQPAVRCLLCPIMDSRLWAPTAHRRQAAEVLIPLRYRSCSSPFLFVGVKFSLSYSPQINCESGIRVVSTGDKSENDNVWQARCCTTKAQLGFKSW